MRERKLLNILCTLVWIMLLAVQTITLVMIHQLGMVPELYFGIGAGVFGLIWVLVGLILFSGRKKKGGGYVRKVLGCLLAVLICLGCAGIASVVDDVNDTMDAITNQPAQDGVTMAVYVRSTDPAQNLSDTQGYTFATVTGYETQRTEQTIAAIEAELGERITVRSFTSIHDMVDGLYSGEVDALILNSAYVTLLEEEDGYQDFSEKTRILFETVTSKDPSQSTQETEGVDPSLTTGEYAVMNPVESIDNTPFVVYISGSDTRSYLLSTSRSDVNILMVVNPETKQILLLNTPRDYFVANPAGGGVKDKLTHCGIYGISCSMQALANLYQVDVDYYAQINFTGFEILIDSIGGVEVYSDVAFSTGTHSFQAGANYLNGEEALAFARARYALAGGDNDRGKNQMKVIQAVIQKVTSGTTIISNYAAILDSLQGMLSTNLTSQEIGDLVKMQLSDMAQWNVLSYAVTGTGGSDITYSMPGLYCYVMYPHQNTVDYGAELIDRVLAGEILTASDMIVPE